MRTDASTAESADGGSDRGWAALAVLLAGTFMAALDVSIVNVAAPAIQSRLGVSGADLQLVISGYTVSYAALLVTGARLGDDFGHRRMFLLGLAGFTLASLSCGLASSSIVLILARVAQGLAAAAMTPQVVTVIQLRYDGEARARALARFAIVVAVGATVGQILGGALISANIAGSSWRPVFLVNVPVGVLLLALGPRVLPRTRAERAPRSDLVGVALLTAAVLALIVPLVFGHEAHWAWWTWASLATVGPLCTVLMGHLQGLARRGGDPLLDLSLLRRGPTALGLLVLCAQTIAYGGFLFVFTLHLQRGLGYTPLRSGLTLAPFAIGFALASLTAPRLSAAAARAVAVGGLVAMAGGYAGLGLLAHDGAWHDASMLPLLAIAGAGFGAGYSPVLARTLAGVPAVSARDASGLFTTVNQLSYAVGVATIGSQFLDRVRAPTALASGRAFAPALATCGALGLLAALVAVMLAISERHAVGRRRPCRAPALR
jgi:EmrB/QacA subfamily drug resistance transporter